MSEIIIIAKELYSHLHATRKFLSTTNLKGKKDLAVANALYNGLSCVSSQLSFTNFNDSKIANLELRTYLTKCVVEVNEYKMRLSESDRDILIGKLNALEKALENEIESYKEVE